MASLEHISYTPRLVVIRQGQVHWETRTPESPLIDLPQIAWADGSTWGEANLWAQQQLVAKRDPKTVLSSMGHLLGYAKWLETEAVSWSHFPPLEAERCLTRFRGALIEARDSGLLAPTTVSARMAAVIRFYRWVQANNLLTSTWPLWKERETGIRISDRFGFEHSIRLATTDLAIPSRKVAGSIQLEDGLLPVSTSQMHDIMALAASEASDELSLMLALGFQTGLRIGSISDLRVETIFNASLDPIYGWHRLEVGPGARPPVRTKYGIDGRVPIPTELLERLQDYATSTRRLRRLARAASDNRNLLFLTRSGNPYSGDSSRAMSVELGRLRKKGAGKVDVMAGFHFHRTRATFATTLMRAALKFLPVADAVELVRDACLHKDDRTTFKYVKLIQHSQVAAEVADAFTESFLGLARGHLRAA